MDRKRRFALHANVDLVPMIDIVFQLILFFLVSTTFAVLPGINLNLPESTTAQGNPSAEITITARDNGDLWFNKTKVSLDLLDKNLASFDTNGIEREKYPVTLDADSEVTNGTIVHIFDVLRKNGFSAVNLRTTEQK
jgi:biopolymer transport protein ExbD